MESKYYYNEDHSDNIMLLDVDPNCIMMKERMIEKVLIDKYADYDNTKEWIPMTPFTSKYWHKRITSLRLAKDWCIGCRRAETILEATTQNHLEQQNYLSAEGTEYIEGIESND